MSDTPLCFRNPARVSLFYSDTIVCERQITYKSNMISLERPFPCWSVLRVDDHIRDDFYYDRCDGGCLLQVTE